MSFSIRNVSSASVTYLGQTIGAGQTYAVPASGVDFSTDLNLITDLISGNILISVNNHEYGGQTGLLILSSVVRSFHTRMGYYSTPVNIRQTAATAANATVFSLRNPAASTKTLYIERVNLVMSFDTATPITRALLRYSLVGFGSATPSGGTTQNVAKLDSSSPNSVGPDIRFLDTGLTTTGVSFGNTIAILSCPAVDGSISNYNKNKQDYLAKLSPGEGLAIRLSSAAVTGLGLCGEIVWSER